MILCANVCPMLCFSAVVPMVTMLVGHRWPVVCAAASSASKTSTFALKIADSKTPATALPKTFAPAAENDTVLVGSLVHLTKVAPPSDDQQPAGSKTFGDDFFGDGKFADQGFKRSRHDDDDDDGFAKHNTFRSKDGFGYGKDFKFDRKGGARRGDDFVSSTFDDDDAAGSMPKFSMWHFDKKPGNPAKSYPFADGSNERSFDELEGPEFDETEGLAGRRAKRKKEPHPSATEYDNYEYADVEEPDDGAPADFEADDPEYGALADADAYDYY